jgi:Zn-dependent peptidase ImmA (M78 family)
MPAPAPEILIWARETAGLSREEAAKKLDLKDNRRGRAVEKLAAIEAGQTVSRSMLLKMAHTYRRPLLTFYLESPPIRADRGEDFRRAPDKSTEFEPIVDTLVRNIRARQAIVRGLIEEEDEARDLDYIASARIGDAVQSVTASIRRVIGVDRTAFRAQSTPEAAFSLLRAGAEAAGIFVILIGSLGSHHTALDTTAFRGFALADPVAPFIAINDQDAKAAWSFTLLHELAHLWLGQSGISGSYPEGRVERFCNDVASDFLLSADELDSIGVNRGATAREAYRLINAFAAKNNLSRAMIAYRLYRAGRLDDGIWFEVTRLFHAQWRRSKVEQRGSEDDSAPSFYVVRRHRLGRALVRLVARTVAEGVLSPTRAGKVLGVSPGSVMPLLAGAHRA